MIRPISHSEASTALDCQSKHAFAYTGRLTGGYALKPKSVAPQLREGRAWGAAVAAWHSTDGDVDRAMVALEATLSLDAADQQEAGVYDPDEHRAMHLYLQALLSDYIAHTDLIRLDRLERELMVPIPSRTGVRDSNRYRLQAFVDGIHVDDEGRDWIVEFKLRKQLTKFELIAKARQTRWYAWAWRKETGREVAGIILEERLNATPKVVALNKDGTPSKVQSCRPEAYEAAFEGRDDEPDAEVVAKLQAKEWSKRHPLILTPRELDEAGRQLASVGSLIHQLDTGALYPVRNPSPMRCPGCAFRDICGDEGDTELVEALFERRPPKHERKETINGTSVR